MPNYFLSFPNFSAFSMSFGAKFGSLEGVGGGKRRQIVCAQKALRHQLGRPVRRGDNAIPLPCRRQKGQMAGPYPLAKANKRTLPLAPFPGFLAILAFHLPGSVAEL